MSNTLSIMPAPFSTYIEYEKPEHPPPTTPTRRPDGTGFCWLMISLTFLTAFGVRLSGATLGLISGAVVVAIRISLKRLDSRLYQKPGTEQLNLSVPIGLG